MKLVAWIWSIALLFAVACSFFDPSLLPRALVAGMIASALLSLPALWSAPGGLFVAIAPSGRVRAGLALLLPIFIVLAGTPSGVDRWMEPPAGRA